MKYRIVNFSLIKIFTFFRNSEDLPQVSALQQISYPTFHAKYFNWFKPDNIILFLQDALSVEDLSSHSSEMKHISKMIDNSNSLYLPSVEDPAHLAHELPSKGYNVSFKR